MTGTLDHTGEGRPGTYYLDVWSEGSVPHLKNERLYSQFEHDVTSIYLLRFSSHQSFNSAAAVAASFPRIFHDVKMFSLPLD